MMIKVDKVKEHVYNNSVVNNTIQWDYTTHHYMYYKNNVHSTQIGIIYDTDTVEPNYNVISTLCYHTLHHIYSS